MAISFNQPGLPKKVLDPVQPVTAKPLTPVTAPAIGPTGNFSRTNTQSPDYNSGRSAYEKTTAQGTGYAPETFSTQHDLDSLAKARANMLGTSNSAVNPNNPEGIQFGSVLGKRIDAGADTPLKFGQALNQDQANAFRAESNKDLPPGVSPTPVSTTAPATPATTDGGAPLTPAPYDINTFKEDFNSLKATLGIQGEVPQWNSEADLIQLRAQAGLDQKSSLLNALDLEASQIAQAKKARTDAAQAQGDVPLGTTAGRISTIEKQENERLAVIQAQRDSIANEVKTSYDVIGQIMDAKGVDYNNAKQAYDDQYNHAQSFMNMVNNFEDRKDQKNKQVQDDASAKLNVLYNNITQGSLEAKNLSPQQQAQVAQLEAQAGMPQGTFQALVSRNPKSDLIGQMPARIDEKGNSVYDFIFRDQVTGEPYVESVLGGYNAEKNSVIDKNSAYVDNLKNKMDLAWDKLDVQKQVQYAKATGFFNDATGEVTGTKGQIIDTLAKKALDQKSSQFDETMDYKYKALDQKGDQFDQTYQQNEDKITNLEAYRNSTLKLKADGALGTSSNAYDKLVDQELQIRKEKQAVIDKAYITETDPFDGTKTKRLIDPTKPPDTKFYDEELAKIAERRDTLEKKN